MDSKQVPLLPLARRTFELACQTVGPVNSSQLMSLGPEYVRYDYVFEPVIWGPNQ